MKEIEPVAHHSGVPNSKERTTWRPHHDWRFWVAVFLMLTAMVVYVMSDDLAMRPRPQAQQPKTGK